MQFKLHLKDQGVITIGTEIEGPAKDFVSQTEGRPLLFHNVPPRRLCTAGSLSGRAVTAGIAVAAAYPAVERDLS